MDELVNELGVGRQSLYNTFGSKDGLFSEAQDTYALMRLDFVEALLSDRSVANVERCFLHALRRFTSSDEPPACFATRTMIEAGVPSQAREKATMPIRALEDAVTECLKQSKAAGELMDSVRPRYAARMLVLCFHGIGVEAQSGATYRELAPALRTAIRGIMAR